MSKKNLSKSVLMVALITGNVIWGGTAVHAEEPNQAFTLDPMIVTAQRTETRDLDTPATTNIITEQNIKEAGYKNVFDAIEHQVGLTSTGYGDAGQDFGFSSGRTVIRGYDRGTLIMVDGIPMNLKNYNSLDGIPIDMVQQIEIIKGAAGTLYGSEAMGGVINIVTKKAGKVRNDIAITGGNINRAWEVNSRGDKYIVSFGREYFKEFKNSSMKYDNAYDTNRRAYNKDNLFASVSISKDLTLNYMHTEANNTGMNYLKPDASLAKTSYSYDDKRDNVALIYDDNNNKVKSNLTFNRRRVDGKQYKTDGTVARSGNSSNFVLYSINFDNNKKWDLSDKSSLLAGFTANKEKYKEIADSSHAIDRDSLGVYVSYDHKYTDRLSSVIGLRGHFVKDNGFDGAHNAYLPQLQTLYKINDATSLYVNVGKAFEMPAVNSKYSRSGTGANSALKPQEGWTYETGIKHITETSSTKFAVFNMQMDNKFAWRKYNQLGITPPAGVDPDTYIQVNLGEFRNTGVEFEYNKILSENWQYNAGFTYQNPEAKDSGTWEQQSARIQLTTGAKYSYSKLWVGMNLFYSGDREDATKKVAGKIHKLKDNIKLNAVISYAPDKNNSFKFNLYNLLDRDNVLNVSENLDRPFNWTLSYNHSF